MVVVVLVVEEETLTKGLDKCLRPSVMNVVVFVNFLLNQEEINQFFVATVFKNKAVQLLLSQKEEIVKKSELINQIIPLTTKML